MLEELAVTLRGAPGASDTKQCGPNVTELIEFDWVRQMLLGSFPTAQVHPFCPLPGHKCSCLWWRTLELGGDYWNSVKPKLSWCPSAIGRWDEEDPDIRKVHCRALRPPGRGHSWGSSACSIPGVWEEIREAFGVNGALPFRKAEPSWLIQLPNAVPIKRVPIMPQSRGHSCTEGWRENCSREVCR